MVNKIILPSVNVMEFMRGNGIKIRLESTVLTFFRLSKWHQCGNPFYRKFGVFIYLVCPVMCVVNELYQFIRECLQYSQFTRYLDKKITIHEHICAVQWCSVFVLVPVYCESIPKIDIWHKFPFSMNVDALQGMRYLYYLLTTLMSSFPFRRPTHIVSYFRQYPSLSNGRIECNLFLCVPLILITCRLHLNMQITNGFFFYNYYKQKNWTDWTIRTCVSVCVCVDEMKFHLKFAQRCRLPFINKNLSIIRFSILILLYLAHWTAIHSSLYGNGCCSVSLPF